MCIPGTFVAKKFGFTNFFTAFKYQICNVAHARSWESEADKP